MMNIIDDAAASLNEIMNLFNCVSVCMINLFFLKFFLNFPCLPFFRQSSFLPIFLLLLGIKD